MAKKKEKSIGVHDIKECPDCASQNLVYNEERQQVICRDCGLIYEPLAPEMEKKFEVSHGMAHVEARERIMIKVAEEKPRKKKSAKKKPKKKAAKKKAKKKAAKPKKKAVKKAAKKAKPKKKPSKKKLVKKKATKKAPKKKSLIGHIRARLKKKR